MKSIVFENIILPLSDLVLKRRIYWSFQFLRKSQFWSKDQFYEYQNKRLQQLVKNAYENVPFYNKTFRAKYLTPNDINYIEDLHKLPIISKQDIRKNADDFRSTNLDQKSYAMNSSGSTGEPLRYLINSEAFSFKYACALRGWYWMGYHLGDRYTKLSQNPRTKTEKKIQDFINQSVYLYIPSLRKNDLLATIEQLNRYKPPYIRCYPDPLYFMAQLLNQKKLDFTPRSINTTGNILTVEAKQLIEERFGCPVYDSYSCEGSALFYQQESESLYLGSREYAITEILDDHGQEVKENQRGMHVTTDLWNYSMPFLRYNTQDILEKGADDENSNLYPVKKIIGRDNDVLVTPEGNLLIVHLFTIYFEYFESILQFQVQQTKIDEFLFLLKVDSKFSKEELNTIRDFWQNQMGKKTKIKIEIVKDIPLTASGKRRFLIRNPEIPLSLTEKI